MIPTNSCRWRTLAELVTVAKLSNPPLTYTSPGPRGVGHLAGEMLKQRAGSNMTHINYNGSAPALTDVIAGRVPLMFDIWHSARRFVETRELKLIASASAEWLRDGSGVAAIAETWMPTQARDGMSAEIRAILASPEFMDKARTLGINVRGSTPAELDALTRAEIARWAEIAKSAKIIAE